MLNSHGTYLPIRGGSWLIQPLNPAASQDVISIVVSEGCIKSKNNKPREGPVGSEACWPVTKHIPVLAGN